MTTSEHMTALAREHPGGFVVIPAMFERWAAELEGYREALYELADPQAYLIMTDQYLWETAQAALDAKDKDTTDAKAKEAPAPEL